MATAAPAKTAPKLGAKAGRRIAELEVENGKRKAKAVMKQAEEIAVSRNDRIIRIEYVFVAEGSATEKDFGSGKMETRRRKYETRKPRAKAPKPSEKAPTPRKRRASATASRSTGGKSSGSGRAAGRAAAKK